MKKLYLLILIFGLISIAIQAATLSLSRNSVTLSSSSGSSTTISVTSDISWTTVSSQGWLNSAPYSPIKINGNGTITISAGTANVGTANRSATITVKGTGVADQTITVTQLFESPYLNFSGSNQVSLGSAANSSATIDVSSNLSFWSASFDNSSYPWLDVSPAPGAFSGQLTFTATTANPTTTPRQVPVTLTGTGVFNQPITITQEGIAPILDISATTLLLDWYYTASETVNVTSNTSWTVSCDQPWLSVLPLTQTANAVLTIEALEDNVSSDTRTATITISGSGLTQQITVTQQNTLPVLTVNGGIFDLASTSNSYGNLSIASNTSWTASCDQAWLTLSTTNGTKDCSLIVTATSANTSTIPRTATVTLSAAGAATINTTITQEGVPTLSLSANNISLDSLSNSTETLDITSNSNWSASTGSTWFTVSPASGSNNGTLTITATSDNLSTVRREGTITISSGGSYYNIDVIQNKISPFLSSSSNVLFINSDINSTNTTNIMSNIYWTASSTDGWLTVTPNTGNQGAATLTFKALTENTNGYTRSGTISVNASYTNPIYINVFQLGTTQVINVSPNILTLNSASGSTGQVTVGSNVAVWTATTNATWLTVSTNVVGGYGSNIENILLAASTENNDSIVRSATVTVSGGGLTQTFTVNQSPRLKQTINFSDLYQMSSGDPDFALAATCSSGLTISYLSSDTTVAQIVNGKIHIINNGITTITASQAGNENYFAASDVAKILKVSNLTIQTIDFPSLPSIILGDADFNPGAVASSDLPVIYTSSDKSVALIENGMIRPVGTGKVTITASQPGNDTYHFALDVFQTLTVSKGSQIYATLPFYESFDSTWVNVDNYKDVPSLYWRSSLTTGNSSWGRDDDGYTRLWTNQNYGAFSPAGANNSNHSARYHSSYSGLYEDLYLYINFSSGTGSQVLTFWYNNMSGADWLQISLSMDGGITYSTPVSNLGVSIGWSKVTVNLGEQTSTIGVIRFRAKGDYINTDIGIDEIKITPIVSDFAVDVTKGTQPLTVNFKDESTGNPTSWNWDFDNDGKIDDTTQNPSYTYTKPGIYSVKLLVSNSGGQDSIVKTKLDTVFGYATLPYSESFDNTWLNRDGMHDVPSLYWKCSPVTGNNSWARDDNSDHGWVNNTGGAYMPAGANGSVHSARFHSYNASIGLSGYMDLYVDFSSADGSKALSFWYNNKNGTDSLKIYLSTDGGTSFNPVYVAGVQKNWTKTEVDLGNLTSATGVIRFEAIGDYGNSDIGLDEISVYDSVSASFIADVISGAPPLTVSFTDQSTGNPTSWSWDFNNDGVIDATTQNPQYTYADVGLYTVKMVAWNAISKDSVIKVSYIDVNNRSDQTITFGELPSKNKNDSDFDPGATASSGLPVNYISSNSDVATVVDEKIHITGVGTSDITASQSGNIDFNPAQDIIHSLLVNPLTGVVSVNNIPLELYPNPAKDKIYIKRHEGQPAILNLVNLSGIVILTKYLQSDLENIDVSGLPSGIYILQICNDQNTETRKVVIE